MARKIKKKKELTYLQKARLFDKKFDPFIDQRAGEVRDEFLKNFPISSLASMTLDDYVIGKRNGSFCTYVEARTKAWAYIQGATAAKFGIYFGKTKKDRKKKYRVSKMFGTRKTAAFRLIRTELLRLIRVGRVGDYEAIDNNDLSQLFKAKILSLYFPQKYLNVCSDRHLEKLATKVGIHGDRWISERQHLLLKKKREHKLTKSWSNPKYMRFLYATYMPSHIKKPKTVKAVRSKSPKNTEPDYEYLAKRWREIGKISEKFALEKEKDRLRGLGLEDLVDDIKDLTKKPSYGYDFRSSTSIGEPRYIEVKSVGVPASKGKCHFFMSDNQLKTSQSKEHRDGYYFYFVIFGDQGRPVKVAMIEASRVHAVGNRKAIEYSVSLGLQGLKNLMH